MPEIAPARWMVRALALAALLALLGAAPAGARVPPTSGVLLGVSAPAASAGGDVAVDAAVADVEARLGRRVALVDVRAPWRGALPKERLVAHLGFGRLPMVTLGPVDTRLVARGALDADLAARARALAALGRPVLLRPFPGMDDPSNARRARDPRTFRRAWLRLDRALSAAHAGNVRLVWCPSRAGVASGRAARWLPPLRTVDWLCTSLDGSPDGAGSTPSASALLAPIAALASTYRRPVLLADVRAHEGAPGVKAAWLGTLDDALATAPRVRAVVFRTGGPAGFASSPSAVLALRTLAARPQLGARSVKATTPGAIRPAGALVPPVGVLLGAYTNATSVPPVHDRAALRSSLDWLESTGGRRLDVYHYYYQWEAEFPRFRETEWGVAEGRIPMISWDGVDVRDVNAGVYDELIRARARAIRDLGAPVFIRWMAEVDGGFRKPIARSPAQFIPAWRRIVTLFRQEGADNVQWVWCVNVWGVEHGDATSWYPGAAWVDWVAGDGYNWGVARPGAPWRSFADTFADWYAWASRLGKPLMVGETGVVEGASGQKGAWLDAMRVAIKTRMPAIAALVYYDTWDRRGYDWRLRSSGSSAAAWGRLGRDPWFAVSGG